MSSLLLLPFQNAPGRDQFIGRNTDFFGNGDQIRLMRLEKTDERGQECGLARISPKLIRPNSGQIEETLGQIRFAERCR